MLRVCVYSPAATARAREWQMIETQAVFPIFTLSSGSYNSTKTLYLKQCHTIDKILRNLHRASLDLHVGLLYIQPTNSPRRYLIRPGLQTRGPSLKGTRACHSRTPVYQSLYDTYVKLALHKTHAVVHVARYVGHSASCSPPSQKSQNRKLNTRTSHIPSPGPGIRL